MEISYLKIIFSDLLRRSFSQNQGETYLVFESLPSRKFRYLNIALASKGPSAVTANLRTALIRAKIKHSIMVLREPTETILSKNPSRNLDYPSNITGIFLIPVWTKSPFILFDLISRNPHSRFVLGPNLSILLGEDNELIHEICSFVKHQSNQLIEMIVPCQRVKEVFINSDVSCGSSHNFVRVLPTGVDEKYWKPSKFKGEKILVYIKGKLSSRDLEIVESLEKSYRDRYDIVVYGEYSQDQYRAKLREAKVVVFFAGTESQSLAQFEAWSCNVPTFVRVPKSHTLESHRDSSYGSESTDFAPYLNVQTGRQFTEMFELEELLTSLDSGKLILNPRHCFLKDYGMIEFKKKIFTHY